jgi:hypothetical protein
MFLHDKSTTALYLSTVIRVTFQRTDQPEDQVSSEPTFGLKRAYSVNLTKNNYH